MRNKYKQIKLNSNTSKENKIENSIKYNFNSRFNSSKEKISQINNNKITNINMIYNRETEKQKEIYKNKIISKIKRFNPNLKIIRHSSYSRFDNEKKEKENDLSNKISTSNNEIRQNIKLLSINYIKRKKERNSSKKNYSSSNIKGFDSPLNNIKDKYKDSYTLNSDSTSVTRKKKFQIKPYKSNKNFNESENKENICNNIKSIKNNGIPLSSEGNNKNKGKLRTSFKYLIHQAYKNKALSKSFSRFYKSSRSKEKTNELVKEKKYSKNNILIKNLLGSKEISRNNIKNKYLTTNSENSTSFFGQSNYLMEKNNLMEDLEIIFNILKKIKKIINKIDNYEQIQEECDNYIQYYFNNLIHNKLINYFHDTKISYFMKKEIICFLLCYDISFNTNSYNKTGILLKTILNIIYSNYVILFYSFLLKKNSIEYKRYLLLLEKEIANNKIKYEDDTLNTVENNFQYINNYYKMIVDNIYKITNYKTINKNIKFPFCINNKEIYGNNMIKINIISSFFNEAYKTSNEDIYSINDLQKFFYIFFKRNLGNNINNNDINKNDYEKKKEFINNSIKNVSISNFNLTGNNQNINYLLPEIKNGYEYSLVLDLDGTLISYQKNTSSIILRPGLNTFLHKMKKIFELILFTSASHDYVDPIVNFIEKDEKFFDYILYRKHLSYDEKGEYFKNLNLLNRDIKKIIIVDDTEKSFKLHKSNGINIKTFYGENDNMLNILTQILFNLKLDADKTGDIRIGLKQIKKGLIYKKIENVYK